MKYLHFFIRFSLFGIFLGTVALVSCETDPELNVGDNTPPSGTIVPEKISEHLKLTSAVQLSGSLSKAPDGQLRINIKDTVHLMRAFSFGSRVVIKHPNAKDITGFYVAVAHSSHYYDVPIRKDESNDSTAVFYLGVEELNDVKYPVTFSVVIQPHDNDKNVWDEFIKEVTIEDPETKDKCDPTITKNCADDDICITNWDWIWEFTLVEDNTGDFRTAYAPGMAIMVPSKHGGCCWNGFSIPSKYDPYCVPGNPEYVPIDIDNAYYIRFFEAINLYDNGTFARDVRSVNNYYHPDSSDYCAGQAGYVYDDTFYSYYGNHNFSPGATYIQFSNQTGGTPSGTTGGWSIANGSLFYTCKALAITYPFHGEKWTVVYRKRYDGEDLQNFFPEYWD